VADRKKMEGHCSTGRSPQWAVVPMEEESRCVQIRVYKEKHYDYSLYTTFIYM